MKCEAAHQIIQNSLLNQTEQCVHDRDCSVETSQEGVGFGGGVWLHCCCLCHGQNVLFVSIKYVGF